MIWSLRQPVLRNEGDLENCCCLATNHRQCQCQWQCWCRCQSHGHPPCEPCMEGDGSQLVPIWTLSVRQIPRRCPVLTDSFKCDLPYWLWFLCKTAKLRGKEGVEDRNRFSSGHARQQPRSSLLASHELSTPVYSIILEEAEQQHRLLIVRKMMMRTNCRQQPQKLLTKTHDEAWKFRCVLQCSHCLQLCSCLVQPATARSNSRGWRSTLSRGLPSWSCKTGWACAQQPFIDRVSQSWSRASLPQHSSPNLYDGRHADLNCQNNCYTEKTTQTMFAQTTSCS